VWPTNTSWAATACMAAALWLDGQRRSRFGVCSSVCGRAVGVRYKNACWTPDSLTEAARRRSMVCGRLDQGLVGRYRGPSSQPPASGHKGSGPGFRAEARLPATFCPGWWPFPGAPWALMGSGGFFSVRVCMTPCAALGQPRWRSSPGPGAAQALVMPREPPCEAQPAIE